MVAFIKPAAQINQLAAFTAKRAPTLLFAPFDCSTAGGAFYSMRGFPGGHVTDLYHATGKLEFDILVGLLGACFRCGEQHEACCKAVASATQFRKVREPGG